ncbi:MAG: NADH-quinone oxidoreductase subunit F, partial [Pirellulales bacterium]
MPKFEPVLLARINKPDRAALAGYRAEGGYEAFKKSLSMEPDAVTTIVKDAGLRGRGGAGFSAGLKWTFLPKNHPGPIYLCVNADESEPGTFNNRILMEEDPHQLLEGIAIACHAIRSHTAYIYLRYEYGKCYRVLDAAIRESYA